VSTPPSSAITDAASVLLARGPGSSEVYLVRRAENLRFFGGFVVFPGGKVGGEDGPLATTAPGLTPRHVAAVRELFEETGVLLARTAAGSFPAGSPELVRARHDLNNGRLRLADLLSRWGLALRADDLALAGTLVTPPFSAMRFATGFFVAQLPAGQAPEVWPGELAEGYWSDAGAALDDWARGGLLLSPPTVSLLDTVRGRSIEELPERLRPLMAVLDAGGVPPIWFGAGVRMIPLFCRGLPPSTHTNAFLIGTDKPYLLDPGPSDRDEQQRLLATLDDGLAGRRLAGIVLTHHHPDHVGAAAACADRFGAPVLAHPLAVRLLDGKVRVDRHLAGGDRLDLGAAPDGSGPWYLVAVHTPGHAPDHLTFWDPKYRRLFAGDMVSTLSSVVVAPPEGDLTAYLESLRHLLTYPTRLLLPAHGSPTARPAWLLEEALAHRAKREAQLLEALSAGPSSVSALAVEIYRGLPPDLLRLGELQLLAGLRKLEREGRIAERTTADGPMWQLT
jgi:glyoxylase-like metal-dependent hydrolase (beta-lactamase superfamily II)/8-oxo-dGTP pyrophosphatase MutT (NUDIX family)